MAHDFYVEIQGAKQRAPAPTAEEVELTFQRIELESTAGKTAAADDWASSR